MTETVEAGNDTPEGTAYKKPVAKKAVAKKAATKPKPKAKTAKKEDLIADTAHRVENLTMDKAYSMVNELSNNIDFTYFQLGGVLSVIQASSWYTDLGFDNFKACIEEEFGIGYRKAMYMIDIYNGLVDSGVPWEKVKPLGWSKLKELVGLLTEETVEEWLEIANSMTVLQLQDYIKNLNKGSVETGDSPDVDGNKVTTLTFKVHEDQKEVITDAVDKAKNDADTEHSNVALESICMQYLSGGAPSKATKAPKPLTLKQQMQASDWEAVLDIFEQLWPDISVTASVD